MVNYIELPGYEPVVKGSVWRKPANTPQGRGYSVVLARKLISPTEDELIDGILDRVSNYDPLDLRLSEDHAAFYNNLESLPEGFISRIKERDSKLLEHIRKHSLVKGHKTQNTYIEASIGDIPHALWESFHEINRSVNPEINFDNDDYLQLIRKLPFSWHLRLNIGDKLFYSGDKLDCLLSAGVRESDVLNVIRCPDYRLADNLIRMLAAAVNNGRISALHDSSKIYADALAIETLSTTASCETTQDHASEMLNSGALNELLGIMGGGIPGTQDEAKGRKKKRK